MGHMGKRFGRCEILGDALARRLPSESCWKSAGPVATGLALFRWSSWSVEPRVEESGPENRETGRRRPDSLIIDPKMPKELALSFSEFIASALFPLSIGSYPSI